MYVNKRDFVWLDDKMGGEDIVIIYIYIYTIVKKKLLIPFYLLKKVKNLPIFFNEIS